MNISHVELIKPSIIDNEKKTILLRKKSIENGRGASPLPIGDNFKKKEIELLRL